MQKEIFKTWWLVLIKGIILILLAIIVFINPVATLVSLSIFFGVALLISGIIIIIVSVSLKNEMANWGWKLAEGILDILIGILFISNPIITAIVMPFIIGLWIIFYGIILFVEVFTTKKHSFFNATLEIIISVLIIVFGFIITFNPISSISTIITIISISLLIMGFFNIIRSIQIKKIS
jgi:uncharacterized membrane protein HdeD (DUF308 family)